MRSDGEAARRSAVCPARAGDRAADSGSIAGARRRRMRLQNFADGSRRHLRRSAVAGRRGLEFARGGGEMRLCRGGIRQFGLRLRRPSRRARRGGLSGGSGLAARDGMFRRWRNRLARTHRAQIAFDHRQPIDHMAERVVNDFERILGVAVGFRLAEADVGQFALDDIDQAAIGGLGARCGCSRPARQRPRAGLRDGAECPAARPRPVRDCRRGDRRRSPAVRANRTRAVRDGRTRRRCRCRPACGRGGRTMPAARLRVARSFRRPPAARGFPASRSARRCAVRGSRRNRCCPRSERAGRPWTTACGRRR